MFHPPGAPEKPEQEWIEIHNPDAALTYQLLGCAVTDDGGETFTIDVDLTIAPGERLTFGRSNAPGFVPSFVYGDMSLGNADDEIELTCAGTLVDRVAWDATFPAPVGASMELALDGDAATNDDGNFGQLFVLRFLGRRWNMVLHSNRMSPALFGDGTAVTRRQLGRTYLAAQFHERLIERAGAPRGQQCLGQRPQVLLPGARQRIAAKRRQPAEHADRVRFENWQAGIEADRENRPGGVSADAGQRAFYESRGLIESHDMRPAELRAFVRIG